MRLDHLLSKERRSREVGICCLVIKERRQRESEAKADDNFIKVSGADALRGDTRSHPEHDG